MTDGFGGFVFLVPPPRGSFAAWFVIAFAAVVGFAVLVMLVVAASYDDHVVTDPGSAAASHPVMADACAPFCLGPTGSERSQAN